MPRHRQRIHRFHVGHCRSGCRAISRDAPVGYIVDQHFCAVRLDGEQFDIGITPAILPDRAERISPRLLHRDKEQSIGGSAARVECAQLDPLKYVPGTGTGSGAKAVIAVHPHLNRASRKREVGEDFRRLTVRGGVC